MDHYRMLQVTRDAEPEVIERAYKALARKYHPDMGAQSDRDALTRRMQAITEAYGVLRDPESRRRYDLQLGPEQPSAWAQFMEHGLVGLFLDAVRSQKSG